MVHIRLAPRIDPPELAVVPQRTVSHLRASYSCKELCGHADRALPCQYSKKRAALKDRHPNFFTQFQFFLKK